RLRSRNTLHLGARLDDVPELARGAKTSPVALLRFGALAANQRAVGEEVDCEVPRPHVILPSLEELVREGFSAHFVECDQYLAHAHERSRFAVEVAEILPDRSGLLEGRERRLILTGVVEEEPAERFQRGRG